MFVHTLIVAVYVCLCIDVNTVDNVCLCMNENMLGGMVLSGVLMAWEGLSSDDGYLPKSTLSLLPTNKTYKIHIMFKTVQAHFLHNLS